MDYLKSVVPSQLVAERGSNLVVINPGSANIRIGIAQQDIPFNVPHCVARYTTVGNQVPKRHVQDQMLNSQITTAQHMEREKAYDIIASLLKIPFLDEEVANNSFPRKMARVEGYNPPNTRKDTAFSWSNIFEKKPDSSVASGINLKGHEACKGFVPLLDHMAHEGAIEQLSSHLVNITILDVAYRF